ncbi:hypothetical protein U8335_21215 [Roseiconus lacunae]|uniref:hypothetical protein n=1 Tax=Roseiconus lacunae TaxID=2605694 RepID=UPI0030895D7D|nr:hypothetical protein U8335_21215 [Stieleria sp. HD01]
MKDRSRLLDQSLVFSATFVIVLGLWPSQAKRQILRCHATKSTPATSEAAGKLAWTTYSMPVDHPSLPNLKALVEQWQTPENDPVYVTAKWRKQVAEFYEKSAADQSGTAGDTRDRVGNDTKSAPVSSPRKGAPTRRSGGPTTASISDNVITASYEIDVDEIDVAIETDSEAGVRASDIRPIDEDAIASSSDLTAISAVAMANSRELAPAVDGRAVRQVDYQPASDLAATDQPASYQAAGQRRRVETVTATDTGFQAEAGDHSKSGVQYWRDVRASATASIDEIEHRAANPPVVFGEVKKAGPSQTAFNVALLLAIGAVCGYPQWQKRTPLKRGIAYRDQPIGVIARLGTFGGMITLAFLSALVVWY